MEGQRQKANTFISVTRLQSLVNGANGHAASNSMNQTSTTPYGDIHRLKDLGGCAKPVSQNQSSLIPTGTGGQAREEPCPNATPGASQKGMWSRGNDSLQAWLNEG